MVTSSELTLNLAIAFGVYMIAAALGGVIDSGRWVAIIEELRDSPALTYVTGVLVYALGVALVLVHNDWSGFLPGLVSFIGWVAMLEGIAMLVAPKPFLDITTGFLEPGHVKGFALFALALGAVLLILGLTGNAN